MTDTKKLSDIIDDKGLKKVWIAEKLGISKQNFSQKMKGKREFTKYEISRLKDLLDLSDSDVVDIFLSSESTKSRQKVEEYGTKGVKRMLSPEFVYGRIQQQIRRSKHSERFICRKTGIQLATLHSWKNHYPSFECFLAIAEALEILPSELLMDDPFME